MLTAKDIRAKNFRLAKGYDKAEVDEFMTTVSDNYDKLERELSEIRSNYETLSKALTYYKELENALQKTMVIAQKNADDTLQSAKANAKITLDTANNSARETLENAKRTAKETLDAADSTARQLIEDASKKAKDTMDMANERAAITISNANHTATRTINDAGKKASVIDSIAKTESLKLLSKAQSDYADIKNKTINLIAQYENYKAQFKRLAMMQFDLINSKAFDINIAGLKEQSQKFEVDVDFDKLYEEYKSNIPENATDIDVETISEMDTVPEQGSIPEKDIIPESDDIPEKDGITESDNTPLMNEEETVEKSDITENVIDTEHAEIEDKSESEDSPESEDGADKIDGVDTLINNVLSESIDSSLEAMRKNAEEKATETEDESKQNSADISEIKEAESYNIQFKAQTSTKNRKLKKNSFFRSRQEVQPQLEDEVQPQVEDTAANTSYDELDSAFTSVLNQVLSDAKDDVTMESSVDTTENEPKVHNDKIAASVIKAEPEPARKTENIADNNEKQDNNLSKSNKLNLGITFNEDDDDNDLFSLEDESVFSTPKTNSDDDDFIFDDNDESDSDSIGITFDFLDK